MLDNLFKYLSWIQVRCVYFNKHSTELVSKISQILLILFLKVVQIDQVNVFFTFSVSIGDSLFNRVYIGFEENYDIRFFKFVGKILVNGCQYFKIITAHQSTFFEVFTKNKIVLLETSVSQNNGFIFNRIFILISFIEEVFLEQQRVFIWSIWISL